VPTQFEPNEFLPDPLPEDPIPLFRAWFEEAHTRSTQPNPNAMTLATVDAAGNISARIVLCKAIEPGGGIVFHTNYDSRKGRALAENPRVAAVFHWDHLDRQVRVEGLATKVSPEESDAYFATRPWDRRIGAWASQQSQPIASRDELLARVMDVMLRFGLEPLNPPTDDRQVSIPRPPHWGGYRIFPARIELWLSGPGRVHERAAWERTVAVDGETCMPGAWSATRLQP
jgi:pyridoxamine 5'-phosphate oxidase